MKLSKIYKNNDGLRIAGSLLLLSALVAVVPIFTQRGFNPAKVQPAACRSGKFHCGYQPTPADRLAAVPQSSANFIRHRGLPSSVDLSPKMPPIGNQGRQGSCVGWSSTYAIRSFHENARRNWGYDSPWSGGAGEKVFTPAFTYNQINGGSDDGSYPTDALDLLVKVGALPWKYMPYAESDFRAQPTAEMKRKAGEFRMERFEQLDYTNPDALKAVLASGSPILIGVKVYDNFYQLGSAVYDHFEGPFRGGHAITVVGYDDGKTSAQGMRGAFRLFNSWDTDWGTNGYGWIAYDFMSQGADEAYTLIGQGGAPQPGPNNEPDEPEPTPGPGPSPGPGPGPNDEPDEPNEPAIVEDPVEITDIDSPKTVAATRGTYADRVVVSWSDVENAVTYEIQRANPGEDEYEDVGNSDEKTYTDTAVQPDVSYQYRIVAVGDSGRSNPEESPVAEGFAKAQVQNSVPGQVVGLEAGQGSDGKVDLTWSPAGNASSYTVARYDSARRQWAVLAQTVSGDSYEDARPVTDGPNRYRVRGVNRTGSGPWSDAAEAMVGGQNTPPAAVQGVEASDGQYKDKIVIKWQSVPTATKYYVYRYNVESEEMSDDPFESTGTEYTDQSPEVKSGSEFAYFVLAENAAGYGEYGEPAVGRTNPSAQRGVTPPAPSGLTRTVDNAKKIVTLRWSAVKEATEYYIFRKKETDREFRFVKNVTGAFTYQEAFPGNPGDLFLYAVRSKSELGESPNSNVVSAFINVPRQRVNHRVMAAAGIDRFVGNWKAIEWDGNTAPVEYVLSIQATGANFACSLKMGSAAPKSINGSYAAMSSFLETDGFKMRLSGAGKTAVVDISSRQISPNDMRLAFIKDR